MKSPIHNGGTMADMETVKARYPGSSLWHWMEPGYHGTWTLIYETAHDPSPVVGEGNSEAEAWANARARIEAKNHVAEGR